MSAKRHGASGATAGWCQGAAIALLAMIVAACAARHTSIVEDPQKRGRAELEMLPSPQPERPGNVDPSTLPPEKPPETLSQALPVYPAAAVADGVACVAEILYHIETDGSAKLVRLTWNLPPPAGHVAAFESAIGDAVATWRFVPAYQLRVEKRADGTAAYEEHVIPKAQRAAIRFRVEDGRGVVE